MYVLPRYTINDTNNKIIKNTNNKTIIIRIIILYSSWPLGYQFITYIYKTYMGISRSTKDWEGEREAVSVTGSLSLSVFYIYIYYYYYYYYYYFRVRSVTVCL